MAVLGWEAVGGRSGDNRREQGWVLCQGPVWTPAQPVVTLTTQGVNTLLVRRLIVKLPSPRQTASCFQGWGGPRGKGCSSRWPKYRRKWGEGGRTVLMGGSSLETIEVRPELHNFSWLLVPCRETAPFCLPERDYFPTVSTGLCQPPLQLFAASLEWLVCTRDTFVKSVQRTPLFATSAGSGYAGPGFLHLLGLPSSSQHQQGRSFPCFAKLCMVCVSTCFHTQPLKSGIEHKSSVLWSLFHRTLRGQKGPLEGWSGPTPLLKGHQQLRFGFEYLHNFAGNPVPVFNHLPLLRSSHVLPFCSTAWAVQILVWVFLGLGTLIT